MSENVVPNIETIKTLQEAWKKGELQFIASSTYCKQRAPLGYIYYLILYQTGGQVVYQGAYMIKVTLEAKLQSQDRLIAYLCFMLAQELE
ncbi:hypothetical protein DYU05_03975 [Mucilaginibacter terrenus]|uniref:Uncharacterized protein n=1 Tax=Mucilaginibacter terrenus TaxID=2482727 RepID=A0A3E2NUT3_9SPHI|nr:hypothetical protein [Mucilaginibacter terrenus]RFZ84773.1 hypothetical protein DYU05_03975 [Mucilaginibacter terrenus]